MTGENGNREEQRRDEGLEGGGLAGEVNGDEPVECFKYTSSHHVREQLARIRHHWETKETHGIAMGIRIGKMHRLM